MREVSELHPLLFPPHGLNIQSLEHVVDLLLGLATLNTLDEFSFCRLHHFVLMLSLVDVELHSGFKGHGSVGVYMGVVFVELSNIVLFVSEG